MVVQLPRRYRGSFDPFDHRIRQRLTSGVRILDAGAGRNPTVPPDERPFDCTYVGIDADASELALAPRDAYTETIASDLRVRRPDLVGHFDLVVSAHTLEHIAPLHPVLVNIHAYLRPGGVFVALLSGTFGAHGLANRVLPERIGARFIQRNPDSKFPASYDRCYHGGLARLLRDWSEVTITPLFVDAHYFSFSPALQRVFLMYEDWACRGGHANLASHYILDASR